MNTLTILVVDDDARLRQIYRSALTLAGYRAMFVDSGWACLELLKEARPDVIVMDIMMPSMDGLETCRRLRETFGKDIPVLFLTAADHPGMAQRCHEAGGDFYLVKQGSTAAILAKIQELTANQNASRA